MVNTVEQEFLLGGTGWNKSFSQGWVRRPAKDINQILNVIIEDVKHEILLHGKYLIQQIYISGVSLNTSQLSAP